MKKGALIFVFIVVLTLIAVLTNPDQNRHKEVLRNRINAYMQHSVVSAQNNTSDEWNDTSNTLAIMLSGVFVDQLLENLISTENYVVFSLTKITWQGETKIIGIGAFGNVYFTKKIDRTLDEGLPEK